MSLTAWSSFYDWILPEIKGDISNTLVQKALIEISRDFCERSRVHRVELTSVDVVAETGNYALVTSDPTNLDVSCVMALWYNGQKLDPKPLDDLPKLFQPHWQSLTGTPQFFTQYEQDKVRLVPAPSDNLTAGLDLQVALKPTLAATGLTDWIASRWMEDIAKGVKGKLMLQADKPWSNPNLGALYKAEFDEATGDALVAAAKAFGRARVRTRSRFF